MKRPAAFAIAASIIATIVALSSAASAADLNKVLRVASADVDTLDPHQYNDSPSFDVIKAIFDGLYEWDYLASPTKLYPVGAAAMPDITDNGKVWTIRVRPGIFFSDDPAFGGKPREATAYDWVYSLKRWLDPNLRRGGAPTITDLVVGARAAVDAARRPGAAFDYDAPIAGLRASDRWTIQIKLTEANYPNIEAWLTNGVVAREVVQAAGGDIRTRAVGTGAYRLKEWKRGSRLVLEANPRFRPVRFPETADPAQSSTVKSMRGKAFPQIATIEVNVIEEDITRLLEFERGKLDYVQLRGEVANRLLANGKLKPEYAARGIERRVFPEPYLFSFYFNVADPVIGGMANERVALRRAIALAIDTEELATVVYAGQAMPANQIVPPRVSGHDSELGPKPPHDQAAANALLDRFGYGKRDSDGYRRAPDGKPLTLTLSLRSGAISREIQTLWKKDMDAIGLRMAYHQTPFQDMVKELEGGKFQLYFGGYGGQPSGYAELQQLDSRQPPTVNASRFKLDDYDRAMDEYLRTSSDAVQIASARKMSELARTFVPLIPTIFRLENDYIQPWVQGFSPPVFQTYWKYLDIDLARQRQADAK